MFNQFIVWISKLYTYLVARRFAFFGERSIIKPVLNTSNQQYISIGNDVNIGSFSWVGVSTEFAGIQCNCANDIRLKIGNNVSIGNNAFIIANNNITIGSDIIMSNYVFISDHNHRFDNINKNIQDHPLTDGGFVNIGNHVFIGTKSSILPNTKIGDFVIIGANTVVTNDIPSHCVVAGNPARIIKRFDFEQNKWCKVS